MDDNLILYVAERETTKGLPTWQLRVAFERTSNCVFIPVTVSGADTPSVLRRMRECGVGALKDSLHVYAPASWLAKEYPECAELCAKLEREVRLAETDLLDDGPQLKLRG